MTGLLVTPNARLEVPPVALARLREADPRLNMRFIPSVAGSYWAITREWAENDPRRAAVQQGLVDPAFTNDIVATLPGDCSPQEAGAFVERFFVKSDDPKGDAVRRAAEAVKATEASQKKQLETFLAEQEDVTRTTTAHDRRLLVGADTAHPMVPGADLSVGTAGALPAPQKKRGRSADTPKPE